MRRLAWLWHIEGGGLPYDATFPSSLRARINATATSISEDADEALHKIFLSQLIIDPMTLLLNSLEPEQLARSTMCPKAFACLRPYGLTRYFIHQILYLEALKVLCPLSVYPG